MNIHIKDKKISDALGNLAWVFLTLLSFTALKRLHAAGQNISDLLIDSLGIAAIYAVLMFIIRKDDPSPATTRS